MNIQWYPGHMTKTRRMMEENLALVDVVIELLDARVPYSSKNPDIDALAKNKYRILLLSKSDLADEEGTKLWASYYESQGFAVILTDALAGKGMKAVTDTAKALMEEKIKRQRERGRLFVPIRAMICGIPNVGKSTFINKYVGKTTAKTGDKPGVTRGKQWIKVKKDFELLDTPGILWPKFEDETAGLLLAFTGAINDEILDVETLATEFVAFLMRRYPALLTQRYKVTWEEGERADQVLEKIALARGMKTKGSQADTLRCAKVLLDEYRGGKLGRLTLEGPEEIKAREEAAKARLQEKEAKQKERKRQFQKKN